MTIPDDDIAQLTATLVKKIGNFTEAKMRSFYAADSLDNMEEELALEVMRVICEHAAKREPKYQKAILALADVEMLLQVMGKRKVAHLYNASLEKGYKDVAGIFSRAMPAKRYEGEIELFLQYGLGSKALGERKYLARKPDPVLIDKLTYDLDPLVMNDLLKNPRLTESQVVKIAARRPNKPEILEEIFDSSKWIARYQVKLAIARNPYTPPRIALGLLTFLTDQDLMDIAQDQTLHEDVKRRARVMLKAKSIELKEEQPALPRERVVYKVDLDNATIKPAGEADSESEET